MEREGKIQSAPQQQINLQPMIEQIRAVQYAFREIADSIESDKARPTVDTALKIAAALGVPFHDLIQARITP